MGKNIVLGIDLGTTNCCVAYIDDHGKPTIIPNSANDWTTPSVVCFEPNSFLVGKEAKEMLPVQPGRTCAFIKRQMGHDYTFTVDDVQYSPEHVSSIILRKLVQDASQYLGRKITDVVITCPAYFFIKERQATKLAGELAGLNVLQIVNEPSAAAVAYGLGKGKESECILVYDLGGGTFDITVMYVTPEGLEVIRTDGDHQLGGKDWDDRLVNAIAEKIKNETGTDEDPRENPETYYDILAKAEETKKRLSVTERAKINISHDNKRVSFEITRAEFESLTRDLLEQTIDIATRCLWEVEDSGASLPTRIILVGGSSRMPQVARALEKTYGVKPELFDPDEAVAKGAAIIGNGLQVKQKVALVLEEGARKANPNRGRLTLDMATPEQIAWAENTYARQSGTNIADIKNAMRPIKNVSSKTFGAVTTDNGFRSVMNIIYRNRALPCRETITFQTERENQGTVKVELMENLMDPPSNWNAVYQEIMTTNDQARYEELYWELYAKLDESTKLWEGDLAIQQGLRRGSPINITYELDENGLLTITAEDPASHNKLVHTVNVMGKKTDTAEFQQATQSSRILTID